MLCLIMDRRKNLPLFSTSHVTSHRHVMYTCDTKYHFTQWSMTSDSHSVTQCSLAKGLEKQACSQIVTAVTIPNSLLATPHARTHTHIHALRHTGRPHAASYLIISKRLAYADKVSSVQNTCFTFLCAFCSQDLSLCPKLQHTQTKRPRRFYLF